MAANHCHEPSVVVSLALCLGTVGIPRCVSTVATIKDLFRHFAIISRRWTTIPHLIKLLLDGSHFVIGNVAAHRWVEVWTRAGGDEMSVTEVAIYRNNYVGPAAKLQ